MVTTLRPLGKTGVWVSDAGLGAWGLGGGSDWGPTDQSAALQTVEAALDAGVNLIDTAPVYGDAEALLGRALRAKRDRVLLAGKCGIVRRGTWSVHDLSPSSVRAQLEESLKNLQTDRLDLYQLHWPDPAVPLCDALGELTRLREEGKIRWIGVCNLSAPLLQEALACCDIASVQNPCSLLRLPDPQVLRLCREAQTSFIGYGPLAGGVLSGKYKGEPNLPKRDARKYFYQCYRGEAFTRAQQTALRLKQVAAKHDATAAQVALAWAKVYATCTLCGARSPQQSRENFAGPELTLTEEEITFLTHESY